MKSQFIEVHHGYAICLVNVQNILYILATERNEKCRLYLIGKGKGAAPNSLDIEESYNSIKMMLEEKANL